MDYTSETDQILLNVVDILRQSRKIFGELKPFKEVPLEELNSVLETPGTKDFTQGNSRISLAKEILTSNSYSSCVPIIIRDNLNNYAMKLHLDANLGGLSVNQIYSLNTFPKGLLTVAIIEGTHSFKIPKNVEPILSKYRKDIVSFESLEIQSKNSNYSVTYNPRTDSIYAYVQGQGFALKAKGLDLKLDERMPGVIDELADHYRMNITNTFFM